MRELERSNEIGPGNRAADDGPPRLRSCDTGLGERGAMALPLDLSASEVCPPPRERSEGGTLHGGKARDEARPERHVALRVRRGGRVDANYHPMGWVVNFSGAH